MILYNTNGTLNNFGFSDVSAVSEIYKDIRSRNIKPATSHSKKHTSSKISAENIKFLKSLSLKIK